MIINIDIGGQIEEQEFDKSDILVGSSERADIILNYEGIGDLQLKIQISGDFFQVTDLNSGHGTFIDGNVLGPGESANLKSNSEIEVGGIYLTVSEKRNFQKDLFTFETDSKLLIEEDTTQKIENLLKEVEGNIVDPEKLKRIEADLANSELEQAETVTPRENFKQDLFSQTSGSSKSSAVTRKQPSRKIKSPKAAKKIKPRLKKTNNQSIALLLLMIIAGSSYLCYEYIYKDSLLVAPAKSKSNMKLIPNFKKEFLPHVEKLHLFVEAPKCPEANNLELCNVLIDKLIASGTVWKVLKVGKTLVIGIEDAHLDKQVDEMFNATKIDTQNLKEIIQAQYSDYFSFDDFVQNQYLPPLKNYTYKRDENRDLFFLLGFFLNNKISLPGEIDSLFFFTYSNFSAQIAPQHFLEISREAYLRELVLKDTTLAQLHVGWQYHLTQDFDVLVSGIGSTEKISFNPDVALNAIKVASKKTYLKNMDIPKCEKQDLFSVCFDISKRRAISLFEGVIKIDKKLLIYFDLNSIRNYFLNINYPEYTNSDRRNLIESLKNKTIDEKKAFQENGYVNFNPVFDYNAELLLADFFDGNYAKEIISTKDLDAIVLVGVTQNLDGKNKIESIVDAPVSAYNQINLVTIKSRLKYLIKSKIPLFNDITSKTNVATEF